MAASRIRLLPEVVNAPHRASEGLIEWSASPVQRAKGGQAANFAALAKFAACPLLPRPNHTVRNQRRTTLACAASDDGCVSDGETLEEAFEQGCDAVKAYLLNCAKHGDPFPKLGAASGRWRQRVPRSLHARLVAKARQEGVSLNTLVTAMIAEGLGKRRAS
jgi:antitoxin HicB